MSFKLVAQAFDIKVGNPLRKMVLIKLADQANDDGVCWPSYESIARSCEISRRSVVTHIQWLEENGFLRIERRYNAAESKNYSNRYHLTLSNGKPFKKEKSGSGANAALGKKGIDGATPALGDANDALGGATPALSNGANPAPKPIIKPINETINEAGEKNGSKISIEDAINHLKISAILPTFGEVNKSELTAELYKFNQYYIDKGMPEKANTKNLISWFQLIKTEDRNKFTALDKKQAPANAPKIDVSKRYAHLKG